MPTSFSSRSRISLAALLVKVIARIRQGDMFSCCTITRVFPLPGPANISSGPCVVVTALRCGSLSPASKSFCSNIPLVHFPIKNILYEAHAIVPQRQDL